jgi:hypothetical protein
MRIKPAIYLKKQDWGFLTMNDSDLDAILKQMATEHRPQLPSPGLIWFRTQIAKVTIGFCINNGIIGVQEVNAYAQTKGKR